MRTSMLADTAVFSDGVSVRVLRETEPVLGVHVCKDRPAD